MKLVVIVTGASGAIYARRLLHVLADLCAGTWPNEPAHKDLQVDWVASATAPQVWLTELGEPMPQEIGAPAFAAPADAPEDRPVPPALPSAAAARRESGPLRANPPTEVFGSNVLARGARAASPSGTPTLRSGGSSESPPLVSQIRRWDRQDFSAPFASGSNAPDAVLVMPCSMSALSRVAHGGGEDLAARACEVALKERRRLVLVVRETPLSLVHLRNMVAATEAGAVVLPAVPSFYGGIQTLEEAVDTVVARALDHAGLRIALTRRWGAPESA
ncbi:UbiX family flavin prenyltransferase [Nannocystis sp. ILAH1]|uniref:UbiX family flavin prenyltransferase n=1 Tax=unclassified Nannocystis TaxID=2627009 RepID=UPI00226D7DC2|nr:MULTISPECIES: UbiX family flavin prenyltransferase [unclassified Nannocystis]MCY0986017.1 UbiX family flavin prenyltransferase [Nannocystis sp. ILAH1]MCY1068613.1 UbiX family flavin prenyltransferase [Nannocystis sp. RBIL2]